MSYSQTTWGQLKAQLSQRLQDQGMVFWVDDELDVYLTEALRAWAAASLYWRERITFNTVAGQAFYVLPTVAASTLAMTATDRETFKAVQYSLIESTASQGAGWTPTDMFTLAQITSSLNDMRNRYLTETGVVLTRSTQVMPGPPDGRVNLDDDTIDVRRACWIRASDGLHFILWREDEWSEAAYAPGYETASTPTPYAYTVTATAPVQLLVAPPPSVPGTLELISVFDGATLDPASADTSLGLPDNVSPAVKWGVLSDVLKGDGQATDPVRVVAADRRWAEFVELGKMQSAVANVIVGGSALMPVSVFDMDAALTGWQDGQGQPSIFAVAGWNLVAFSPVPDGVYGVSMDVVRNAPIPANDNDFVQVGLEDLQTIINYAEYCALFKVGGDDLQRSEERMREFYKGAAEYNAKLKANALFAKAIFTNARREPDERPRRLEEQQNVDVSG